MAFGAELRAALKLDSSEFQRGLAQAGNLAGQFGDRLERKLGAGDAFKSFVAGVGLSIESLAEKIAEAFVGGTREGFKEIEAIYERVNKTQEQTLLDNMETEEQRLAYIRREIEAAERDRDRPRASRVENMMVPGMGLGGMTMRREEVVRFTESEQEQDLRVARARERLAELDRLKSGSLRKEKTDNRNLDKELTEARRSRIDAELNAAGRVAVLTGEQAAAELAVEAAAEGSLDRKKAEIELEKTSLKLIEAKRQAEEEREKTAEENRRLAEKQARDEERHADKLRQLREAEWRVEENRRELADSRGDAYRVGLGDAAAGQGGVTQTSKARAREIQRLEAQAQRIFQGQSNSDFRDPQGLRISAGARAEQLMSRAGALRKVSSFLKSADRDPFAAQVKAVMESEKHLKSIKDDLKPQKNAAP